MLLHHSERSYDDLASEAAGEARDKFTRLIDSGRASAQALFEKIHTEVPDDCYARMGALRFGYAANFANALPDAGPPLEVLDADDPRAAGHDGADDVGRIMNMVADQNDAPQRTAPLERALHAAHNSDKQGPSRLLLDIADHSSTTMHSNAIGQAAQAAGVDVRYLRKLIASPNDSLRSLALDILHTHFGKTDLSAGYRLVRSVDGETRGFMSDRFRRIDSRPLLETFAETCQAVGAVPIDGVGSDTRVQLKAYLPMIFEPVENEPMIVGLAWHNSDFGCGSHALALTILRIMCTNKATTENCFRQTHSGGRLANDIAYREETLRLDTAANQARLKDEVAHLLGPDNVNKVMGLVKRANDEAINWSDYESRLKKHLTKQELSAAALAFNGTDVVNLPPGKTVWRASNALSWIAGQTESPDRRLELERIAGAVYAKEGRIDVAA